MALTEQVIMPGADYQALCDALRARLGTTGAIRSGSLGQLVQRIPSGADLPALTNPGDADKLLAGYQLIDQAGQIVTGKIANKTASNLTASGKTVTVQPGYYPAAVSKDVATATQATPSISVSSGGLITASATQSAGYVAAGTKSATRQLTVQAAQTITPGTSNKTIASGRYLTGTQTIKGDANLVAANIVKGVSIFGVTGTAESGGASPTLETCTVNFELSYYTYCTVCYEVVNNNQVTPVILSDSDVSNSFAVENIRKGSLILVYCPNSTSDNHNGDVVSIGTSGDYAMLVYQANGDGGITVM